MCLSVILHGRFKHCEYILQPDNELAGQQSWKRYELSANLTDKSKPPTSEHVWKEVFGIEFHHAFFGLGSCFHTCVLSERILGTTS